MKQILSLLLVLFSSVTFAQEEPTILSCPRLEQFESTIQDDADGWCSSGRFSEAANALFKLENNEYLNNELSAALHDNTHDTNWIVSKSTQDIRKHAYCLELACTLIQERCTSAGTSEYRQSGSQQSDCINKAAEFAKLEQLKAAQVAIENAKRKSRSNQREKMRAIEVRASQYFIPLLDQFHNAYRRFTQKTPTFIANPL